MLVPDVSSLNRKLCARLDHDMIAWITESCAAIVRHPAAVRTRFPSVGRSVPSGPLDAGADPSDPFALTIHDAVRARMLGSCGDAAAREAVDLYRFGDALERRGVLRALDVVDVGDVGLRLVEDALRGNDTRLIAAALGPFGAGALDDHSFRHAVLKCVFVGIPLSGVSKLDTRADAGLARMLVAYAHERVAAGRSVPADIWPLVDRYPPTENLAAIEAERMSVHADRRAAAEAALATRYARRNVV